MSKLDLNDYADEYRDKARMCYLYSKVFSIYDNLLYCSSNPNLEVANDLKELLEEIEP